MNIITARNMILYDGVLVFVTIFMLMVFLINRLYLGDKMRTKVWKGKTPITFPEAQNHAMSRWIYRLIMDYYIIHKKVPFVFR
jgi:hypothetical protein